jgi:hypothetical protein
VRGNGATLRVHNPKVVVRSKPRVRHPTPTDLVIGSDLSNGRDLGSCD